MLTNIPQTKEEVMNCCFMGVIVSVMLDHEDRDCCGYSAARTIFSSLELVFTPCLLDNLFVQKITQLLCIHVCS